MDGHLIILQLTKYSGHCYLEAIMAIFLSCQHNTTAIFKWKQNMMAINVLPTQFKGHCILLAAKNDGHFFLRIPTEYNCYFAINWPFFALKISDCHFFYYQLTYTYNPPPPQIEGAFWIFG